jgi:gliding motility-associated-like protein
MTLTTLFTQTRSKVRLDLGKKVVFVMLLALLSPFLSVSQCKLTINTQPPKLQRICVPFSSITPRLQVAAVTCPGGNLTYQWQKLRPTSIGGTGTWVDIGTSTPGYIGANTPTLDITTADSIIGKPSFYKYRNMITSSGGINPCISGGTTNCIFQRDSTNVSEIIGVRKPIVKYNTPLNTDICEYYNGGPDETYNLLARVHGVSQRDTLKFTWRTVDMPGFTHSDINTHPRYTYWVSTLTQSVDTATFRDTLTLNNANNTPILLTYDKSQYYLEVFSPTCGLSDTNTVPKRILNVHPVPNLTVNTPNINICQDNAFTMRYSVTNARHDVVRGSTFVDWTVRSITGDAALKALFTDTSGTGNITKSLTIPAGHGLSVGVHTINIGAIYNTTDPMSCNRILPASVITVNVYPEPTVEFITPNPPDTLICQGQSGIIKFKVSNATFNGSDIGWSVTVNDPSGILAPSTLTGQGNKIVTNTFPNNLPAGQHVVTLTGISTSGTPSVCAGTVIGIASDTIKVIPTPDASMNTTITIDKCQGSTKDSFEVIVSNAVYPTGSVNLSWSINYTDSTTGTIVGAFTGTGNGTFKFVTSNSLPIGTHTIRLNSITLVSPNSTLGVIPTCSRTLFGQTKRYRVYSTPSATFSRFLDSACEGTTPPSFTLNVTNAVYPPPLAWNLSTSGKFTGAAAGSPVDTASTALTSVFFSSGSGNGNFTFTPPNTLAPGRYKLYLNSISLANTPSCTRVLTDSFTLHIFPQPTATIFGTNMLDSMCEGSTVSYSIGISNAHYSPFAPNGNRNWSLAYSNGLGGTLPSSPRTGSGGQVLGAFTTGSGLTTGDRSLTLLSIENTNNACVNSLPGTEATNTKLTRKIYPKPNAALSTAAIDVCEGTGSTFDLRITNARKRVGVAGAPTVPQPWTLTTIGTYEGAAAGSPSISSTSLAFPTSGTDNDTFTISIPDTLRPGRYIFTLNNPVLNVSPLFCAGTTGPINKITINVYPKPTVSITPAVDSACQYIAKQYTVTIGNAFYEPSSSNVNWTYTYDNETGAGAAPTNPNGTNLSKSGSGNGSVTYNTAAISLAGIYEFRVNSLNNTSHTCNYPNTKDTFRLVIKQRPRLFVEVAQSDSEVCFMSPAKVTYRVDSVAVGQAWQFTYNAIHTTPGGTKTISGVGPVALDTFMTNPFSTTGAGTISFSPIELTAANGCASTITTPTLNIDVAGIPDVTANTTNGTGVICGDANTGKSTVTFNIVTTNMIVGPYTKTWKITYDIIGTQDTSAAAGNQIFMQLGVTHIDTGNGAFQITSPHQTYNGTTADAGIADVRRMIIRKIEFIGASPLNCSNTNIADSVATFTVNPRPKFIFTKTNPDHICVTEPVITGYNIFGFKTGDVGTFSWNGTNPTTTANLINIAGPSVISSSITTPNTVQPGIAIQIITSVSNTTTGCVSLTALLPSDTTIVDPPSQPGTLNGSATVCEGNNSGTLYLTGPIVGKVVRWEYSENDGFTWLNYAHTDTFMNYTNASLTRRWRVVVKNLTCPINRSNEVIVFVHPQPKVQIINYTNGLCTDDSVRFTLNITGVPTNHTWKLDYTKSGFSSNNGNATFTGRGSGQFNYVWGGMTNFAGTATIQLKVITNDTVNCSKDYSSSAPHLMTIVVGSNSVAGPIALVATPSDLMLPQNVCRNSSGTLKYKGAGNVLWWYHSNKTSGTFPSGWDSTFNPTYTHLFNNIDTTTRYRVRVRFGSCPSVVSTSDNVLNVIKLPIATITGSDTICENNSKTLNVQLNGQAGSTVMLKWLEGSTTKSGSFSLGSNPPSTTSPSTITTSNLTTTTNIVLQSIEYTSTPACRMPLYTDAIAIVTINPLPTVTLNSVTTPVCQNATSSVSYSVAGVASTTTWSLTYRVGGTTFVTSGKGGGTFSLNTPSLSTPGNVVVEFLNIVTTNLKTNCNSGTLTGISKSILVYETTTPGSVASSVTICKGGSATIDFTPGNGTILRWNFSNTSGAGPYSSQSTNSNSITITNITNDIWVTATSINGVCLEATTSPIKVTVRELPVATITGSTTICSGATASLNIAVTNTYGNDWTIDYLEGTTSKTRTGNGDGTFSITTSSLTSNTDITLQKITMNNTPSSTNPSCGPTTLSSTATVNVNPNPTATLNSVVTPVCQSTTANSSFSVTVTGVPTGQGWSLRYTLNGTSQTPVTNSGSGTFTFPLTLSNSGNVSLILTGITNTLTNCVTDPLTGSISATIVVDSTTTAGTIANAAASVVCIGTNSGTLTYSGGNGAVVRWEYAELSGNNWIALSNTSTTLNWSNLSKTTRFRVVVKNGSCLTANSAATTITVRPLPTASISGSNTICQGSTSDLTVTTSNTFGNPWTITFLEGTTTRTLTGTGDGTFTLTTLALNGITDVTLQGIVLTHTPDNANPGGCPNTLSSTATVSVTPMPNATLNSVGTPICLGSTSTIQFTVSNISTGQGWSINYTEAGITKTTTGNGPGTYTINTAALTTAGANVVTLNSITNTSATPNCTRTLTGQSLTINVDATTVAGTAQENNTVCKGSNSGTINYSGGNGAIVRWEYSINGGSTWNTTGTTASSYSYSNLTQTTNYRVIVKNSSCLEAISNVVTITVRDLPTASISGSNTVCQGTTGNLTVAVSNSFSNPWTITYLEGTTTRTLSGTGDGNFTLTTLTLATKTDVTLQSIVLTHTPTGTNPGNCANGLTSTATVDVIALPNATLNSVKTPVCEGSTSNFQFTISNIPTGQGWSLSYTEGGVSKTTTGNGPGTYSVSTSSLTTPGKVAVTFVSVTITSSTPTCTRTLSATDTIMVDATTVAGSIAGSATVCKGSNSGTLTYSGGNGSVVRWEYSINSGATWSTTGSTASTYNYSNVSQTTEYRVVVKNGACGEAISAPATLTVRDLPYATISGSTTICQNSTVGLTVNVTNSFGNPWTITYLEGTSTLTLSGSGDGNATLTTSTLSTTSDVTLLSIVLTHSGTSTNPACGPNTLSSTATVNVTPLPTATLNKVVSPICQGNTSSFEFTVSNVATGQGWTMNYNEGSTTKTTSGNGPGTYTVTTSTLSAGTVTITLNSISTTGLTTNCTRNLTGQTMDITVDPTTTVGALGTDITVCKNNNSGNLTYNVGSSNGAVVRWESSVISASGPWTAISNTTNSQAYINLSQTTFFRVIVKSGNCAEKESNVVTVSVQEIPVAFIGGSSVICAGNTASLTVNIINVSAGQRSVLNYLEGTTSKSINIFGTTGTITTGILNTNTDITLVSITSIDSTISSVFRKGCSNITLTSTATVNVNVLPTATLSTVGGPICQGNSTTYTVTVTNVPTGHGWNLTGTIESNSISPNPSGTGSGTFTFNTPVLNTPPSAAVSFTLITNSTTGCTRVLSETKNITVDATTTVGTIASDATVCKGDNSGSVDYTAGSTNGSIVRWESSTISPSTAFNGIMNTAASQTYSNLTATTYYRAVVKNGVCKEENSNVVTITVRDLPNASIATSQTICEGNSTNFTITVSKTFGQSFKVYYLIGSVLDSLVGTGDGVYTISTGNLTSTVDITLVRIVQTSGSPICSQQLTGTITITVNELPRASFTNVPSSVCQGSTATFTIDVSKVKTTQSWSLSYTVNAPSSSSATTESKTGTGSGSVSITTTATMQPTTSTITLATITNTSTGCATTLSDAKVITVDPTTVGGTLSTGTNTTVCKGANSGTLTLSGNTGSVVRWESSTDNGATWSNINNTTNSYSYSNITQTTRYRAFVQSGVCTGAFSTSITITVNELPTATVNNVTICAGNTASLTVSIGNTFGQSWTLTFVEGSTTRTLTGTGDGNFTLTTGVLNTTTTIALKSIQITSGTVLCSSTLSGVGVVTVNALPTATHNTAPSSVCDGSTVDFTVTIDNVLVGQSWTLNYRIGTGSTNTKSGTGPGIFTITSPVFTNATTAKIVQTIEITSITNTTTGCTRTASEIRNIDVFPKSIGGTTSASVNPLCANSATTSNITVSGFVGSVIRWEYSDDNQATWQTLSNTASTITVSNLSQTREYRAVIQSGPCASANSSIVKITVIPTVEAVISGSPQICAGKVALFNVLVTSIGTNENWSLTYRVNGTLQTAMTGRGPGNFPLTVGPPTTNTAGTITVKLETITNTTFSCANNNLSSQAIAIVHPNPIANFTVANACEDSSAVFINTSTILSGTLADFTWNFGDGTTSKDGNPTHTYGNTGNFSVSLLAQSAMGCRDSITKTITIFPRPVANFSFRNTCQDTAVKFTDGSSVAAGNTIRSFFWNFGDGTTSNTQSPSHKYAAAGTYTVTLTVVSNNGCASTKVQNITVWELPEPNYVASPVCENSVMNFVNTSSIGVGTMTYRWDFAGQGNSTSINPSHTFTGFGSFNVSLTATSNNGCVKTLVKPVTVWANPIADFTVADVCIGETSRFINTSRMPAGSTDQLFEFFWNFGDSSFSIGKDPLHTYAKDGIYSVSSRATSNRGCINTVTKSAVVHPLPVVTFAASKTKFCDGDTATLTANDNMRQYVWTLNGAIVGTTRSIIVSKQGWYHVRITSPIGGCSNEDSIFITVWPLPVADAGRDTSIHKGQSVNLRGKGAGIGGSYVWSPTTFLTPSAGNVPNVTSKPDVTIEYLLTVTDINGCKDTDNVKINVLVEFVLKVHNVVTPNGDTYNDTWIIDNIEAYPDAEVAVFNRYGMEVFNKTGYLNDWNGDDLPDGAYYYVITIKSNDKVYKGALSLLRSKI